MSCANSVRSFSRWVLALLLTLTATITTAAADPDLDRELRILIERHGLTGNPAQGRQLPDISEPLAQLGMQLFFTKSLSGNQDSACVTCHHPLLGGGDGLALSVGVDAADPDLLGPGRRHADSAEYYDGGPPVPRNAPTTFNLGLWDVAMFHDGRVESLGKTPLANGADGRGIVTPDSGYNVADPFAGPNLVAAQARFPVTSYEEMRGFLFQFGRERDDVREHLAARLGDYGPAQGELDVCEWLTAFQQAFNSKAAATTLITYDNIALALGEYQRSQVFVDTPWNRYVTSRDPALLSTEAKQGALLFYRPVAEGGADCVACHRGDFFTDEYFHILATPQIGRGKGGGEYGDDDLGRYHVTKRNEDRYAFRTPTLLNVEVTGPYGHAGAYATLEGIIRHHLDPWQALEHYDLSQLEPGIRTENLRANADQALHRLEAARAAGRSKLPVLKLSDQQVAQLVAFMQTLTDPCVKEPACLARWLPLEQPDPDRRRLYPRDQTGRPL